MSTRIILFLLLTVSAFAQGGGAGQVALTSSVPGSGPGSGDVVGPASSTDNALAVWDGTTGKLLKNSTAIYNGTAMSLPSTATSGLQLYNTVDQTTNYERLEAGWSGNVAFLRTVIAGTGTARDVRIMRGGGSEINLRGGSTSGGVSILPSGTSVAGAIGLAVAGWSSTATSGTNVGLSLTPTYNQASGTAANTDLLVNRTQTAVGSGTQRLLDLQVGGTTQFNIGNTGNMLAAGTAHRWSGYGAGAITSDGSGNLTSVSDARMKDIDGDYNVGLSAILKVNPKVFHWKKSSGLDTNDVNVGLIAQDLIAAGLDGAVATQRSVDVMETVTETVKEEVEEPSFENGQMVYKKVIKDVQKTSIRTKKDAQGYAVKNRVASSYYTVSDRAIIATLINAIKELSAKNDALEARVLAMEKK